MLCWILSLNIAAAEPPQPEESLDFARTAAGVAAAVGEILPVMRACVGEEIGPGVRLIRLRFEVGRDGVPGKSSALWTDGDADLAACLGTPFAALRFQPGDQVLPVEVPVSVVVEEAVRHETQHPIARQ